MGNILKD